MLVLLLLLSPIGSDVVNGILTATGTLKHSIKAIIYDRFFHKYVPKMLAQRTHKQDDEQEDTFLGETDSQNTGI